MAPNDRIVIDFAIQACKMDKIIKQQEVQIAELQAERKEMIIMISRMKYVILRYEPSFQHQLDVLDL